MWQLRASGVLRSLPSFGLPVFASLLLTGCVINDPPGGSDWEDLLSTENRSSWRTVGSDSLNSQWTIESGILSLAEAGGGDITNGRIYSDFHLYFEWKVSPGGNSGVFYFVQPGPGEVKPWQTGPEMQVLDDARHKDGGSPLTSAGAVYDLYPAKEGVVLPAGEWNAAEIITRGKQVEHRLNGQLIARYELGSAEFEARIEGSKFKRWEATFARREEGLIVFQDHQDPVKYRNIRIRSVAR